MADAPFTIVALSRYFRLLRADDSFVSQHLAFENAIERAVREGTATGGGTFRIVPPAYEVVVSKAYGILAPAGDTTKPSAPADASGYALNAVSGYLYWSASTDEVGVVGYQVWNGGTPVDTTTDTFYTVTGLSPSTAYTFRVTAYDAAGNHSDYSSDISFTTEANAAPVWSIDTQALTTSVAYSLSLLSVCSDSDNDPITFSTVSGSFPPGVSANYTAKTIGGTPTTVGNYSVVVRASDGITYTDRTISFEVLNADTTAPSVPTDLAGVGEGGERIDLTWTASSDTTVANARTSGLAGYKVYRDGSLRATLGVVTTYADTTVAADTDYSYTISAFDAAGNESAQTAAVVVSTSAFGWTIADTPYAVPGTWFSQTAGQEYDVSVHANTTSGSPVWSITTQSKNGVAGSYGFTIDSLGVVAVPADLPDPASSVTPDQYTVVIDLSEAATTTGDLPSLTLTGGGSGKPWTFGQPFKKGAANYVTASGPTSFQADIRNRWDDGSIKFAVLSGIGGTTATLSAAASDPGGTALTLAQMRAALTGTNTITVGTQTVTLSTMLASAPHRTVHAGPVMANWIFRQALTVGTDLSLWVDVRYYSNGNIELFPWVENAYLRTVSPVNHVATCSVVVNGVTTSLGSIDFKARTRIPLLSGALSYWHGTNPGITPVHDSAYLKATKLVPNYSATLSSTLTSGLTTSYTPNSRAGYPSDMGAAGGSGSWEGTPSIWYAQSPSASSYAAACVWGLSAGSWSVHYRSGTTFEPFTFTAEPNTSFASSPPAAVAGGSNGTYAGSHAPGFPFLPYLITGRWWFLDELQFIANYHFLDYQSSERFGADAIANPTNAGSQRFAAWTLRSYAQALAALPDTHARRTELIAAWEANCQYWRNKFVDGVAYKSSTWTAVSPQGMVPGYEYFVQGSAYWSRGFMMSYLPVVWGAAWDYELPLSVGGAANHQTVRDRMYLHAVGLAGKLSGSGYNWRHLTTYDYPVSSGYLSGFLTFAQSHAEMKAVFGWTAESDNDADGLNLFQHSGETTLTNASGLPYGSSAAAGVALAVDHGYTGASAAWSRITGASNYTASLVAFHNGESPIFAMLPR